MNARDKATAGAMVVLAIASVVAARARCSRGVDVRTTASSPSAASTPSVEASSVPDADAPPAPKRIWRLATRYPLVTGDPKDATWQMHENAPLVDPDDVPRPTTILLHGMCADSNWTCDWLQYFELAPQWMLCPRAPSHCGEGGYKWAAAAETLRVVETTLASAKARNGARVEDERIVLAGFSQGAYAVAGLMRLLAATPTLHVRGVVLQGAEVHVDAAAARTLGVRVALTAGDLDGAAPAMRAEAARLRREGIDVRYESLGQDEGHFTSVSTGKIVAQLVDWVRAR
jgi:predicted esterase